MYLNTAQPCGLQVGKRVMIDPLVREGPEGSLDDRVIVASAPATHRAFDAQIPNGSELINALLQSHTMLLLAVRGVR